MKYIFYKICCLDTNIVESYVGSTKNFTRRKCEHKRNVSNHHYKVYQFIRDNGGWDNFNMIPIKEVECETKLQAIMIEEEIRCELKANLNSIKAYITEEQLIQRDKDYRIKNKAYICEQKKQYWEANKDRLNKLHQEWYETKKDEINSKRREKYCLVKDEIKANKTFIQCKCGGNYTNNTYSKTRHEKTLKHQSLIESENYIVDINI